MNNRMKLWSLVAITGAVLCVPQLIWSQTNDQNGTENAQTLPAPNDSQQDEQDGAQPAHRQSNDRWLGVAVGEVPEILRAHLSVEPNVGVMINVVVPDSPAAKAGLKQHDIITRVDNQEIGSIEDLMRAVRQSQDNDVRVEWLRGGQTHEQDITMAPRPENLDAPGSLPLPRDFKGFNDTQVDTLRRWMEDLRQMPGGRARWRFHDPSLGANTTFPEGLSVQIERHDDEPAQVRVQRGDEVWELTENDLDQLPADLRAHVQRMLGGEWSMQGLPFSLDDLDLQLPNMDQLDRQFEEMNRRMQQLFDELHDFRQEQRKSNFDAEPATEA